MGDAETAEGKIGEQRLHIAQDRGAKGGIADMADGGIARQFRHHPIGFERFGDMAHGPMGLEAGPVEGDDTGGFLAAMLQGVQAQGHVAGGFGMTVDAENAAFLTKMIVVERGRQRTHSFSSRSSRPPG